MDVLQATRVRDLKGVSSGFVCQADTPVAVRQMSSALFTPLTRAAQVSWPSHRWTPACRPAVRLPCGQVSAPGPRTCAAVTKTLTQQVQALHDENQVLSCVEELPDGTIVFKYEEGSGACGEADPSIVAFLSKGSHSKSTETTSSLLAELVGGAQSRESKKSKPKKEAMAAAASTGVAKPKRHLNFDPLADLLQALSSKPAAQPASIKEKQVSQPAMAVESTQKQLEKAAVAVGGHVVQASAAAVAEVATLLPAGATADSPLPPHEVVGVSTNGAGVADDLAAVRAQLGSQLGVMDTLADVHSGLRSVGPATFVTGMELQVAALDRAFNQREDPWTRVPEMNGASLQSGGVSKKDDLEPIRSVAAKAAASIGPASPPGPSPYLDEAEPSQKELSPKWEKAEGQYRGLIWLAALFAGCGLVQLARAIGLGGAGPLGKEAAQSGAARALTTIVSAVPGVAFFWVAYLVHRCRGAVLGLFEFVRAGGTPDEEVQAQLDLIRGRYIRQALTSLLLFAVLPFISLSFWKRPAVVAA